MSECTSRDGTAPRQLNKDGEIKLKYRFFAGDKGNLRKIYSFAVRLSGEGRHWYAQALPDDRSGIEKCKNGTWRDRSTGEKVSGPDDFSFKLSGTADRAWIEYRKGGIHGFLRYVNHLADLVGSADACAVPCSALPHDALPHDALPPGALPHGGAPHGGAPHGALQAVPNVPAPPAPQEPDDMSVVSSNMSHLTLSSDAIPSADNAMSRFSRLLQSPDMSMRMPNWRADLSPREFIEEFDSSRGFLATIRVTLDGMQHEYTSDAFARKKDACCDAVDRFLRAIDR